MIESDLKFYKRNKMKINLKGIEKIYIYGNKFNNNQINFIKSVAIKYPCIKRVKCIFSPEKIKGYEFKGKCLVIIDEYEFFKLLKSHKDSDYIDVVTYGEFEKEFYHKYLYGGFVSNPDFKAKIPNLDFTNTEERILSFCKSIKHGNTAKEAYNHFANAMSHMKSVKSFRFSLDSISKEEIEKLTKKLKEIKMSEITIACEEAFNPQELFDMVSRTNPIMYTKGVSSGDFNKCTFIYIHHSLIHKGSVIGAELPNKFKGELAVHRNSEGSMCFEVKKAKHIGSIINFFKEIRNANWPEGSKKVTFDCFYVD